MKQDGTRHETEYQEVGENIRYYGNMRFAQLTLFTVILAGIVSISVVPSQGTSPLPAWVGGLAGYLIAVLFWVMEERAGDNWWHYVERAKQIEALLGYSQYRALRHQPLISASNATRIFFALVMLFWTFVPFDAKAWNCLEWALHLAGLAGPAMVAYRLWCCWKRTKARRDAMLQDITTGD